MDVQLKGVKDIGQKDAAVLASSTPDQVSFERREGDMSVLTYFVIKLLEDASDLTDGMRAAARRYLDLDAAAAERLSSQQPGR